jgi:hypothetical protein
MHVLSALEAVFAMKVDFLFTKSALLGDTRDVKSRWNYSTTCPAGRYQSDDGTAKCTECEAGAFNNKTGSVIIADCTACEQSGTLPSRAFACANCAARTPSLLMLGSTLNALSVGKTTLRQGADKDDTSATTCVNANFESASVECENCEFSCRFAEISENRNSQESLSL